MGNKIVGRKIIARANHVLYFLEHILEYGNVNAADLAWQRSIQILLSYAVELILKSVIVFTTEYSSTDEINKELRGLSHEMHRILRTLEHKKLMNSLSIVSYNVVSSKGFKKYIILFGDGEQVVVEDFIDIRYDFTKDSLRNVVGHKAILGYMKRVMRLSEDISRTYDSGSV